MVQGVLPTVLQFRCPAPPAPHHALLLPLVHWHQSHLPGCLPCSSRLASKVVLSKDLNGTLIALADNYPWKTL